MGGGVIANIFNFYYICKEILVFSMLKMTA